MIEANRNCGGNGYALIVRDPRTLSPVELIPVPHELVSPWLDSSGTVWYSVVHPYTSETMTVNRMDMLHVMAYTANGYKGISVLSRASEVIGAGRAAQQYNLNYYSNGAQPAGVLQTETDLGGYVEKHNDDGTVTKVLKKDVIRNEWEKYHTGPSNAQRVAVLDYGLKYTPISVSNKDAQFVEQSELSVQDIARFFGVPLYKLQAGKQSYSSNEQNAIEYVVSTLHPIVTQYEEELTYKLLSPSDVRKGLKIRVNMMAELRGDFSSRGSWYQTMRDIGGFSVNDILALEDMPDVEGGDERYASLNYVPLALWSELSKERNTKHESNT
jgi:HK97 family phage portal protein